MSSDPGNYQPPPAQGQYGQQPGYPGQGYPGQGYPGGYGQSPYPPAPTRTNVLAIISLVSLVVFWPAAPILGLVARSQIKKSGEQGRGLALAAIIVGFVIYAFVVVVIVIVVILAVTVGSDNNTVDVNSSVNLGLTLLRL